MRNQKVTILLLLALSLLSSPFLSPRRAVDGGKIHVTDDLDDVVDDEEDEEWKEWGKSKPLVSDEDHPPPSNLDKMSVQEIQDLMMNSPHSGPAFGFVKLCLGVPRSADMVTELAMKWTKIMRTGAMEVKFMVVDRSTIMFTMQRGRNLVELKEFLLSEPDAYEVKIGDQVFRRDGDPPIEEVIGTIHREKEKANHAARSADDTDLKDEL